MEPFAICSQCIKENVCKFKEDFRIIHQANLDFVSSFYVKNLPFSVDLSCNEFAPGIFNR